MKVICAFPGIGKSHAATVFNAIDLDLPNLSMDEYIERIKEVIEEDKYDYIFVPSWASLRSAMFAAEIPYHLVYPSTNLKDEYIQRYEERGSKPNFIATMSKNWDKFLRTCREDPTPYHTCVPAKFFLSEWRQLNKTVKTTTEKEIEMNEQSVADTLDAAPVDAQNISPVPLMNFTVPVTLTSREEIREWRRENNDYPTTDIFKDLEKLENEQGWSIYYSYSAFGIPEHTGFVDFATRTMLLCVPKAYMARDIVDFIYTNLSRTLSQYVLVFVDNLDNPQQGGPDDPVDYIWFPQILHPVNVGRLAKNTNEAQELVVAYNTTVNTDNLLHRLAPVEDYKRVTDEDYEKELSYIHTIVPRVS